MPGLVALVAAGRGVVEAEPDEVAPQEGPRGELPCVGLVEQRLVLLGMPARAGARALRRVLLVQHARAGAVLAQADRLGRQLRVQAVGPGADVGELAVVPAPVAVVGGEVGLQRHRVVVGRAAVGVGGQARRVFLLGRVVQVAQQRDDRLVAAVDLVAQPPDRDRRVVARLAREFAQLLVQVGAEGRGLLHRRVQRDLGPQHEAEFVGAFVGVRRVLVVHQAQPGDAERRQHAQVLVDLGVADRHAAPRPAGVEVVDAVQRIGLAVQQQAALGVDGEAAQADRQRARRRRRALPSTSSALSR